MMYDDNDDEGDSDDDDDDDDDDVLWAENESSLAVVVRNSYTYIISGGYKLYMYKPIIYNTSTYVACECWRFTGQVPNRKGSNNSCVSLKRSLVRQTEHIIIVIM